MTARPERERKLRELRRILNNAYPEDYRERFPGNLPAPQYGPEMRPAALSGPTIVRKTDAR